MARSQRWRTSALGSRHGRARCTVVVLLLVVLVLVLLWVRWTLGMFAQSSDAAIDPARVGRPAIDQPLPTGIHLLQDHVIPLPGSELLDQNEHPPSLAPEKRVSLHDSIQRLRDKVQERWDHQLHQVERIVQEDAKQQLGALHQQSAQREAQVIVEAERELKQRHHDQPHGDTGAWRGGRHSLEEKEGLARELKKRREAFIARYHSKPEDVAEQGESIRADRRLRRPRRHAGAEGLPSDVEGVGRQDNAEGGLPHHNNAMAGRLEDLVQHALDHYPRRPEEVEENLENAARRQVDGDIDVRRTAFGVGGGEDLDSHAATSHLTLAIFTTLKSCRNESVRYAQLDAVSSWASLPVFPAPKIFILGNDECNEWVRDEVNAMHSAMFGGSGAPVVQVLRDVKQGPHSTVLLGSAIKAVREKAPDVDVYGFINGDILLHPISSIALHKIFSAFREFFVIGRRLSVEIPLQRRASYQRHISRQGESGSPPVGFADPAVAHSLLDFIAVDWGSDSLFRAGADRADAEDYFFWTREFFDGSAADALTGSAVDIPDFHIGRPAYDNWLVHHAIHTWKPVVDATELLHAYHQKHAYDHLLKENNGEAGESTASPSAYWGAAEQTENYNLGVAHGGWQHGLIEFAPLGFEPPGCGDVIHQAAQRHARYAMHGVVAKQSAEAIRKHRGRSLFDWYATMVAEEMKPHHKNRSAAECDVRLRVASGWRPFDDGSPFRTTEEYDNRYHQFRRAAAAAELGAQGT